MTKIKICGMKRVEDIEYMNITKPDYSGFIFAKSSRQIDLEKAIELTSLLDKNIKTVGIFVNEKIDIVNKVAETIDLDIIQLHGEEDLNYMDSISSKFKIWKAIRVKDYKDIEMAQKLDHNKKLSGILLDAYDKDNYGGTGESFNWDLVEKGNIDKLILAGGLNYENISEAIKKMNPKVVDVSSGVETNGFKDIEKIKKIIKKVRG